MFDEPAPRTTRFNTTLEDDCWTKRVISSAPIEKPCQLMIEPELVIDPDELVMLSVGASGPPSIVNSTFAESSSHVPASPAGASIRTLAEGPTISDPLPDVSTKPPSPDCAPPRALIVPCKRVTSSA